MILSRADRENMEAIETLGFDEATTLTLLSHYFTLRANEHTPHEAYALLVATALQEMVGHPGRVDEVGK